MDGRFVSDSNAPLDSILLRFASMVHRRFFVNIHDDRRKCCDDGVVAASALLVGGIANVIF